MDDRIAAFRAILSAHTCLAWTPLTQAGDGGQLASKFAGAPWLAQGEAWPVCGGCGRDLSFFLQLRTDTLPGEVKEEYGKGLLQMFYCTRCDDWEPFSNSHLVRLVTVGGTGKRLDKLSGEALPAKTITGWQGFEDYPGFEDMEDRGINLPWPDDSDGFESMLEKMEEVEETLTERGLVVRAGDKLAGWPDWVQGPEYPNCPECGAQMRPVFQLGSEDNLAYMF